MALIVGEALISDLLSRLRLLVGDDLSGLSDKFLKVDSWVEELDSTAKSILTSIRDSEKRVITVDNFRGGDPVELWLDRLKGCLENIDDVLDEWITDIAIFKLMDKQVTCLGPCLCKLVSFCCNESDRFKCSKLLYDLCPLFPCCTQSHVKKRLSLAKRVKDLTAELVTIDEESKKYEFCITKNLLEPVEYLMKRREGAHMDFDSVKGRVDETEAVVNMLLNVGGPHNLQIISLVGLGGIGKTTLARIVYADRRVVDHFEGGRFWISVSNTFDPEELITRVLKYILGSGAHSIDLQDSLRKIQENIRDRRFLIVFDDVWKGESKDWIDLLESLKFGSPGSKILVTSRNMTVGRLVSKDCKLYQVPELPSDFCWAIFKDPTESNWGPGDHILENSLRDEVLGVCNGLPFIADELTSIVCNRLVNSEAECINIGNTNFCIQYEKSFAQFGRLWLDYNTMSYDSKMCLPFCATLPPNSVLDKKELLDLWMAHGLVQDETSYVVHPFSQLVFQSFFKDRQRSEDECGTKVTFKINRLIQQFASLIGKEQYACQIIGDRGNDQISSKVRHLRLVISGKEFPNVSHMEELRSLVFQVNGDSPDPPLGRATLYNLLKHLVRLRSLVISNCGVQNIPEIVSRLIHLRLLDVSRNGRLTMLPEEICSLYNLETLNVDQCTELVKLPEGMGKLKNLKNLYNYNIRAYLPRGVRQLSQLTRLSMFTVGQDGQEGMTSLDDLARCLGKIDGFFCIEGFRRVTSLDKVRDLSFQGKITCLEIRFGGNEVTNDAIIDVVAHDEALMMHLNLCEEKLEGLRIDGYLGSVTPRWFPRLVSLKSVILRNCPRWVHLPVLARMTCLELLELKGITGMQFLNMSFLGPMVAEEGAFPKLKKLLFDSMDNWLRWTEDVVEANVAERIMPRLEEVHILSCPKLLEIPGRVRHRIQLGRITAHGPFLQNLPAV